MNIEIGRLSGAGGFGFLCFCLPVSRTSLRLGEGLGDFVLDEFGDDGRDLHLRFHPGANTPPCSLPAHGVVLSGNILYIIGAKGSVRPFSEAAPSCGVR